MKARHARTIRAGIMEGRTLWGTPFSDNPYVMLNKPNLFQRAVLAEHQNDPDFHIWPRPTEAQWEAWHKFLGGLTPDDALTVYAKTEKEPDEPSE